MIRTILYKEKYNKGIIGVAKVAFFILLVFFLYRQLFIINDFDALVSSFYSSLGNQSFLLIVAAIFLVPVNWIFEAFKWKIITSSFSQLSTFLSLKVVFAGLAVGILTPSRIGEYGGRFYLMPVKMRWKSLASTFICSLAQNIITITGGIIAILYIYFGAAHLGSYLGTSLIYTSLFILGILLFVYYHPTLWYVFIDHIPWKKTRLTLKGNFYYLKNTKNRTLHSVLFLSFIRYLVYASQYVLVLYFFGIGVPITDCVAVVLFLFLIQTGLPLPPALGVLARGEIALVLWSFYGENSIGILGSVVFIWLINLVVPALIGSFFVIVNKNNP